MNAVPRMNGPDCVNAPLLIREDTRHALVEKQVNVLLGLHRCQLAVVLVPFRRLRVAARLRPDLGNDISEPRIRPKVLVAAQMNAHLRRVRAAQNRTVLHKRDLEPEPRRRNRRADAGNPSAHDAEVIGAPAARNR